MEFPIKFDTVKSAWPIVYIEGSQVIFSQKYCINRLGVSVRQWVELAGAK